MRMAEMLPLASHTRVGSGGNSHAGSLAWQA